MGTSSWPACKEGARGRLVGCLGMACYERAACWVIEWLASPRTRFFSAVDLIILFYSVPDCRWLGNYLPLFQATSRGYPTSRHAYLADPDAHDAPPASGMHVRMRSFPIVTCSGGGCETVEPVSGCSHPHWLAGSSKTADEVLPGGGTW